MARVTRHITVRGRVQGVGYRYSAYYAALRYGISGWVRNRRDGSVEVMAQGDPQSMRMFVDWLHKGPELARVDDVCEEEGSGDFDGFRIGETI